MMHLPPDPSSMPTSAFRRSKPLVRHPTSTDPPVPRHLRALTIVLPPSDAPSSIFADLHAIRTPPSSLLNVACPAPQPIQTHLHQSTIPHLLRAPLRPGPCLSVPLRSDPDSISMPDPRSVDPCPARPEHHRPPSAKPPVRASHPTSSGPIKTPTPTPCHQCLPSIADRDASTGRPSASSEHPQAEMPPASLYHPLLFRPPAIVRSSSETHCCAGMKIPIIFA